MSYSANRFPAILIGGPPHSGKSVLATGLTDALTQAKVEHYLLRATPDGEGNWFHQADPALAQSLRRKGPFTNHWVERASRDIAHRPLPFLVDVGGRPEEWQEKIIDQCTHAILLTPDAASQAEWQARVARYNLLVIANLTSQRTGPSQLTQATGPVLQGVISQLERNQPVTGPVFEAVLNRVKALFNYSYEELLRLHHDQSPVELVVDTRAMYRYIHRDRPDYIWQPQDLPAVLDYLPHDTPLALYGRGPAWLYAAVAAYIQSHPLYQFDVRLGWVKSVQLSVGPEETAPLVFNPTRSGDITCLSRDLPDDYMAYEPELTASLPPSEDVTGGVILSGKLPLWLYTGLARFYHRAAWVAIYAPQLQQAVIVASRQSKGVYALGQTLSV